MSGSQIVEYVETGEHGRARLRVDLSRQGPHRISRYLNGKFCEHLGSNIYNGMDAQIARNARFAPFDFGCGRTLPDGGIAFNGEREPIRKAIRAAAARSGWPGEAADRLVTDYEAGLAMWWFRTGDPESIGVSPDTGPGGQRAQRVETLHAGGIGQFLRLPLHRTHEYVVEICLRASADRLPVTVHAALRPENGASAPGTPGSGARTALGPAREEWCVLSGRLSVTGVSDPQGLYRLSVETDGAANIVIARVSLLPADHENGADPDVIRYLREARLPILRWPGGNFVSGHHWEDAIGPLDTRPTSTNVAWGGTEPNGFGTDEFMAFCRAVGCEPMICVNAGTGTPEEAARWVEYCNGGIETPMGRRRAANGHATPYHVRHWELGNELAGRWQKNWTTPAGYADRYRRFAAAVLAVDPTLTLYANGAQSGQGDEWNTTLFPELARTAAALTDHPLVGGTVSAQADPLDVYVDFMTYPLAFESRFARYREMMRERGVRAPRIAITELQLFASIAPPEIGAAAAAGAPPTAAASLTRETLVSPSTLAEALYTRLFHHAAVRLAPLVEVITHSATVNHGGGLRKEHERVYANPCHYGQVMFAAFAEATPVALEIRAASHQPPLLLAGLHELDIPERTPDIDAIAATSADGKRLLISIVYRGTAEPVEVEIFTDALKATEAVVTELGADRPWLGNDLGQPCRIAPRVRTVAVRNGWSMIRVAPFTLVQVEVVIHDP
jgi:alpha-L-arabinofuranosidase